MLTKLQIKIKTFNPEQKLYYHQGSLLHGLLMQKIASDYAETLHHNALKPFSQYIVPEYMVNNKNTQEKTYIWQISTLNKEAKEKIIHCMLEDEAQEFYLENRNLKLQVLKKSIVEEISYQDLAKEYYLTKPVQRKVQLQFLTPTTFKKNGNFVLFPDLMNIYQSLSNKWNAFATDFLVEDEDFFTFLQKNSFITGYKMQGTRYEMEGIKINSFKGQLYIYTKEAEGLARMAEMLLKFAEFAGIGAKTALGMGGTKIIKQEVV